MTVTLRPSTRWSRCTIANSVASAAVGPSLLEASMSMTADGATELSLTLDDPDGSLLQPGLLETGVAVTFDDLNFKVSGSTAKPMLGTGTMTVTARSAGWRALKDQKGVKAWKGISYSALAETAGKAAGLRVVAQPSANQTSIERDATSSTWDVLGSGASILGYWRFEVAGVLYFGQPTWLLARPGEKVWRLHWSPWDSKRSPGLATVDSASYSEDDPKARTIQVTLDGTDADEWRVGHQVTFTGLPRYTGTFIVTDLVVPLAVDDPVQVTFASPINPVPQPVAVLNGQGDQSIGAGYTDGGFSGPTRLRAVLLKAGFLPGSAGTGNRLEIAVGVAYGESGVNATILGGLHLRTAKWGPAVGLFQIRALNDPPATGPDRWRNQARLTDALFNAQAAYALSNGGTNWRPWQAFTNGSYKRHYMTGDNPYIKNYAPAGGITPGAGPGSAGSRSVANVIAAVRQVRAPRLGLCLATVQRAIGQASSGEPSAASFARMTIRKGHMHYNYSAPLGALQLWTGGSHGYGHVTISAGGGNCWTTDWNGNLGFTKVNAEQLTRAWSLSYQGWSEWYNNRQLNTSGSAA